MKRTIQNPDMLPVRSKEATVIIRKLFDRAVAVFNESNVNMRLNDKKENEMKIKVTLTTENDKHLDETLTDKQIEEEAMKALEIVSDMLSFNGESMRVEKCELIER